MRALVITAELGGNVPPILAVAEELRRRGVEVELAGLVRERGALPRVPFPAATAISPEGRRQGPRELVSLMRLLTGRAAARQVSALVRERRADVVVVDCMLLAAIRGALESRVPTVVLFHTLGGYWRSFADGPFGRLAALRGARPRALWEAAADRLMLTDPELDPSSAAADFADYAWTGSTETATEHLRRRARPRVLVSLSSSNWPGMARVYRRIIAASRGLDLDAVVTTGGVELGAPLVGGDNIEILGWASHAEILPTVDLVIGHGGHSTTMKALAHGVPLLVLPINPTADQRLIGEVLATAGLGRMLPATARPTEIGDAIRGILSDREMSSRVEAAGRRLRARPPAAQLAAQRIIATMR